YCVKCLKLDTIVKSNVKKYCVKCLKLDKIIKSNVIELYTHLSEVYDLRPSRLTVATPIPKLKNYLANKFPFFNCCYCFHFLLLSNFRNVIWHFFKSSPVLSCEL